MHKKWGLIRRTFFLLRATSYTMNIGGHVGVDKKSIKKGISHAGTVDM